MKSQTETSLTLIEGLYNGDQNAWERLVQKYRPRIMNAFQKKGLKYDDADSYTQELFLEVFKRFSNFKREKSGSLRGWINTIIKYRAIDYVKKMIAGPKYISDDKLSNYVKRNEESNITEQINIQNLINLIRTEFSERDWNIFVLYTSGELTVDEITEALEVSKNVVYLTRSRMIKRIKELFRELGKVDPLPG